VQLKKTGPRSQKKKKRYTALRRLCRNEPLARERVQQGRTRGCHQPQSQKRTSQKKKKCYTALKRLRRNEPLARERVQQGKTRGCHQHHFIRLEQDERAEADNCPSATEVTWQAMKRTSPGGSQTLLLPGTWTVPPAA
jgi:hypothetical protein